ncbi:hypothetical protein ACI2KR_08090 [Pseudomonas luteola]
MNMTCEDQTVSDSPPVLQLGVSEHLEAVSRKLCHLKTDMDYYSRGFIGQPFIDDWMQTHNTCAYFGTSYLERIIPFLLWEKTGRSTPYLAMVPSDHVVGACIKGKPEHIKPDDVEARIRMYKDLNKSGNVASYSWYKALGIFCAHEGKHRVAFMRAHNQPAIAAQVYEEDYPSADRITLIKPRDRYSERDGHKDWLALLDGRYVQVLLKPRMARTLLEAYGVQTKHWDEIKGLPDESEVREELRKRFLDKPPINRCESNRTLDLEEVAKRIEEDEQETVVASMDIEGVRIDWRTLAFYLPAPLVLGLIMLAIPHVYVQMAGMALMSGVFGFMLCLSTKIFKIKAKSASFRVRRDLKNANLA